MIPIPESNEAFTKLLGHLLWYLSHYVGLLRSQGGVAVRDIVQFVKMEKFQFDNGTWDRGSLAKEVLAEVPNQVVKWMTMRGIKPLKS